MANNIASIMYTDVVGYSKLTGDNQEIALIILDEHNKILDHFTKHYSGQIVKLTGDGLCALFDSPISAIKCAIDIQKALNKRNKLNVKERQIQIRIGIHYGTYMHKDNDVFGDGINLAKRIEPIAPHGGIAISSKINDMIWDVNDIYIREHMLLDFDEEKIQIYEVYLDLIDWFDNKKNKDTQDVDTSKVYKNAHALFHKGNYSSAIKFATLSLKDKGTHKKIETLSFICHTFFSLGEFDYGENILLQIETYFNNNSSNILDEDMAHFYKMKGNLQFNLNDFESSLNHFKQSLDMMAISNKEYVNEIIYNICIILTIQNKEDLINNYINLKSDTKNDYAILIKGISLFINKGKNAKGINDFIKMISNMKSSHLSTFAYRLVAIIYFSLKKYNKSQKSISTAQDLLSKSSENISDISQRDKFIDNILIHKDIMSFSDKISDYFLNLTIDEIKDDEVQIIEEKSENFYSFCTNCGNENKNNYKFCIKCGNNLSV